jgi:predicted ferric reductase
MSRNSQNKLIVLFLVLITLGIWLGSKAYFGDTFADPYKYVAKGASLSATVMMGFTILLSTRFKILEQLFGGLDKIYHLHKFTGKYSFYLILLHPLFLSFRVLPGLENYIRFWGLQSTSTLYTIGHSVGLVTLIIMAVLIAFSLWIKLPYHIWKLTHEYFGVIYILTALHIILVNADIPQYPLLAIWMYGWLIIGVLSFVYIRFLYSSLGPKYVYRVSNVELGSDTIEVCLLPEHGKKPMIYKPSQFAYLRFISDNVSSELHPYSIASAPDIDGTIKFGIKKLGDHTSTLSNVKEGDKVYIYGPYGRFSESFLKSKSDCIFIGGGIGITPFLGMWDMALNSDEKVSVDEETQLINLEPESVKLWKSPRVHLFYTVNEKYEAVFDNDIKKCAIRGQYNGFKPYTERGHSYDLFISNKKGRISADYIAQHVPDYQNMRVFICGPKGMMDALIEQFTALGIDRERIHTENFNLVTQQFDIPGLARLLNRSL